MREEDRKFGEKIYIHKTERGSSFGCVFCSTYRVMNRVKGIELSCLCFRDKQWTFKKRTSNPVMEKNEMGGSCSVYGGEESRIQGFGGGT